MKSAERLRLLVPDPALADRLIDAIHRDAVAAAERALDPKRRAEWLALGGWAGWMKQEAENGR